MSVRETPVMASAARLASRGEEAAKLVVGAVRPAFRHIVKRPLFGGIEKRWSRKDQRATPLFSTGQAHIDGPHLSAVVEKHETKCHDVAGGQVNIAHALPSVRVAHRMRRAGVWKPGRLKLMFTIANR